MPRAGVPGLHPKPCHGPGTGLRDGNPAPACAICFGSECVENGGARASFGANVDASGAGCGFRARVWGEGDGVCAGKREREKWIQDYAVERGCAPG